ncbi:SEL1-like repeat protein [Magnetovibrio blakemorei]|uniref:Sel1 repeat family protein n=1 Tax=Magnetovibrio blakemorei TaxID=28181 RepID=A0A1E5Q760_9PROT|nr:SEL1-like repeat protein [Magnetovibrio blakemorei]OEJ66863.1 hypothetical protein BEN30_10705 [Magnetovibrio blakemorei]
MKFFFLTLSLVCALALNAWASPLEDGLSAYEAQDYATARTQWERLRDDKSIAGFWAKYYLGILYEHGLGVETDMAKAYSYYRPIYGQVSRVLLDAEEQKKANEALPIDGIYRMAMIDLTNALEMEKSTDKKVRDKATQKLQDLRIAFDVAGFYRHGASFHQNGLLSLNGVGKRFYKDPPRAWAFFTLAAELGNPGSQKQADLLAATLKPHKMKEGREILDSYRPYIRQPF